MEFNWRVCRRVAVAAIVLLPAVLAPAVQASDYPNRNPRIVVGYPAGGATDILARIFGDWLSKRLGQQFIVENQSRCRQQSRDRSRDPLAGRRLYLHPHQPGQHRQRFALQEAEFQFHSRHRSDRGLGARAERDGSAPVGSGKDGRRVHRLCEGQSGQGEHGLVRATEPRSICPACCSCR